MSDLCNEYIFFFNYLGISDKLAPSDLNPPDTSLKSQLHCAWVITASSCSESQSRGTEAPTLMQIRWAASARHSTSAVA